MDEIDSAAVVQAGNSESSAVLVEKYHKDLLNFIHRLVGDEQVVEDLAQEIGFILQKPVKRGERPWFSPRLTNRGGVRYAENTRM